MTIDVAAPIFLLGMPRSGTTWLSQIFESSPDFVVRLSPPYSYDYRGVLTKESTANDWLGVLEGSIASTDKFLTQNWRRESGELPVFEHDAATKLAIKDTRFHDLYLAGMRVLPKARLLYIVRHPAATLWSWRSCKEFPEGADFAAEWRLGECRKVEGDGEYWGFDDWVRLTLAYQAAAAADPERFLVVSYADLSADAIGTTRRMFEFCGVGLTPETEAFVVESQSRFDESPYSVFKGGAPRDAWRQEFPEDILEVIERETTAAGLGALLA